MPRRFVPLTEVAEVLGVSAAQTYALVRSGELPAIKVGGRGQWRVEVAELDAYIAKYNGVNKVESFPVDQEILDAGQAEQARRIAARAAALAARGQQEVTAMSEA